MLTVMGFSFVGERELNLVFEGVGVTALPHFVTAEAVAEGRLEAVLPGRTHVQGYLYAVYPSSGQVPRKVSVFTEFLAARLNAHLLGGS